VKCEAFLPEPILQGKQRLNSSIPTPEELEALLAQLTSLGYRFTRPFTSRESYSYFPAPEKLVRAVILDTETTGTDYVKDRIIELGMVMFEYCPITGQAYRVIETFNQLEDPGFPIPAGATKVHHITNEMVKGARIEDNRVKAFIADASIIIAHNAKFDRTFVEARFPFFESKPWACSWSQLPWAEEGLGGSKLEFLAYRYGFHFDGHRASNDCHALLELLQQNLPESGVKAMLRLLENARAKDIKVSALNSPFDTKDALKERGYRWDGERKTWAKAIPSSLLDQEVEWLRSAVYGGRSFQLELEKLDAFNRFSLRKGDVEFVRF
jgi:DNA polymerase-3 subunit epsilon